MSVDPIFAKSFVDTQDHHTALRESVARLAGKYGRKYFQKVVGEGRPPADLYKDLGQAGFLGVHIDESYGGGGGRLSDLNVIIEEVAAQGCPLLCLVILSICAPIISQFGSAEQKSAWLPGLASGDKKIAFAITEPDAGSNTHKIRTAARRSEDGWILNGQKYWTSAIDVSDAVMVVARDASVEPAPSAGLSLFIVPTNADGLSYFPIEAAVKSTEKQFTVHFDNVKVPASAIVGTPGQGLRQVFAGLNPERVSAAAINNGIARYALTRGADYARERKVWSSPIGAHQGVAHPLAEAYMKVQAARLMTARAAALYDAGEDAAEAANMAKFLAADASLVALDEAIQVHGGNGLSTEYGLADLWFIARLHKTAPVSREMILNHIAQHSLQLPKSY